MAAPFIQFEPGYDIHLLRGQALQIVNEGVMGSECMLKIGGQDAFSYIDSHPDPKIKYQFRFSFDEAKAVDFGITISNPVSGNANAARKPDCLITLAGAEPALAKNKIRNFYLFAEAIDGNIAVGAQGHKTEAAIRIHVHHRIEEIWLTPEPMTVYPNVEYQFSVRARFDDGITAEIANMYKGNNGEKINYRITNPISFSWSSPATDIVDLLSGVIKVPNGSPLVQNIKVIAACNGQTHEATGQIKVSNLLTGTSPLRVTLLPNGACPGFVSLNEVPNILFIAEGFTLPQKTAFEQLITNYVSDLVSDGITSPFKLLKGSINYWMLFVPSAESGATYYQEFVVATRGNMPPLLGFTVPYIQEPKSTSAQNWTIENLLYYVGLPTKSERQMSDADLKAKWLTTTRLTNPMATGLLQNQSLITVWKAHAERRFLDAKDTAFGCLVNVPPSALPVDHLNWINLDPRRMQRHHWDVFFEQLKDSRDNLIGPVFIKDIDKKGKDWDNIVLISANNRCREQNENGYMFSSLGVTDKPDVLTGTVADIRSKVATLQIPPKLPPLKKFTIAHEICHSFGLQDEYGEKPPTKDYNGQLVSDAERSFALSRYKMPPEMQDWSGNVQARKDLEVTSNGNTVLDMNRIKWRYHRIKKCGSATAVTLNGDKLELILKAGQTKLFAKNSKVFIRKRLRVEHPLVVTDVRTKQVIGTIVFPELTIGKGFLVARVEAVETDTDTINVKILNLPGFSAPTLENWQLKPGEISAFSIEQIIKVEIRNRYGPVYSIDRTAMNTPREKAISPLLTVSDKDDTANKLILTIPDPATFNVYLTTLTPNESILVYEPLTVPANQSTPNYPHYEIISPKVLEYLITSPFALNTDSQNRELIDRDLVQNSKIPSKLIPCCSKRKKEIVAFYARGAICHGDIYHPTAKCMMGQTPEDGSYTELCAVCRYILVNLIDPTKFEAFDEDYMKRKIYPT